MKVGFVSLGCPKNLVDGEVMLGLAHQAGHEITASAQDAEVIVVNTCAFIDKAKQESIDTILEVANREEAEYWARRCPLGPGTSLEVRRINDLADFASEVEEGDRLRRERQQEWQSANG